MKTKNYWHSLALVVALALTFTCRAVANQVVNGGFESGFIDWTLVGNTGFSWVDSWLPQSDALAANFGPVGSQGGIQQSVATVVGATYNFDFWLQNNPTAAPSNVDVFWDGNDILSLTNPSAFGYTHYEYTLTASATVTIIKFLFRNDNYYFHLDNVRVERVGGSPPVSVADAGSTLTLLGGALVGLAGLRRKLLKA